MGYVLRWIFLEIVICQELHHPEIIAVPIAYPPRLHLSECDFTKERNLLLMPFSNLGQATGFNQGLSHISFLSN